jgi:hypothetical protein
MTHPEGPSKDEFLHPRSRYRGNFTPTNLAFNANLQDFATQVGYVCGLETNGKITGAESYCQIKQLFKQLKQSKKTLGIRNHPSTDGNQASSA